MKIFEKADTNKFREIRKFESDVGRCTKCGFCTFWCTVYQEQHIESSLARGKNMMIRGVLSGELEYSEELGKLLNECTLCMSCTANCPVKARVPDAVVAARADRARLKGVAFPYNIIYRWLLPRRRLFGSVVRCTSYFQALVMPKTEGSIRHLPLFLSALGKGRHIPQIASRFLRQMVPELNQCTSGVKASLTVGYFIGCMTDFVFPEVGKKMISFLNKNGVEVMVPREQGCCGAPIYLGAGDFETGRKLADNNVRAFEHVNYVVTNCATCASAMKDYVKFLADTPERKETYTKFADKVIDITEFLVNVLQLPASAYHVLPEFRGKRVTWHDPCHLSRHLGVKEPPRQILKGMRDIEFVEMPDADRCCGMAGSFSIYYYDLSKRIADRKVRNIDLSGADIVVTECPGCEIQLIDATRRNGKQVKVMHIMELLE